MGSGTTQRTSLPNICRTLIRRGLSKRELNRGYRWYQHAAQRVQFDGIERLIGDERTSAAGGAIEEAECWEALFARYTRFRKIVRREALTLAPWDWRGKPPAALRKRIDAIAQESQKDPWKAVDRLFDHFSKPANDGFGFFHNGHCSDATDATAGYRKRCGNTPTGVWILGAMLTLLQQRIPEIHFQYLRVAFHPQNPIPTFFNHLAIEVTVGERSSIFDPEHGDMNIADLYERLHAGVHRMTDREAFAMHLCHVARERIEQKRYDEAIELAQIARRIDPASPETYFIEGVALEKRGGTLFYLRALGLLGEAWERNKENNEYQRTIGKLALKYPTKKQTELAFHMFRRILELSPKDYDAHFGMGMVLMQREQYDAAAKSFATAYAINPTFRPAKILLDEARSRMGK